MVPADVLLQLLEQSDPAEGIVLVGIAVRSAPHGMIYRRVAMADQKRTVWTKTSAAPSRRLLRRCPKPVRPAAVSVGRSAHGCVERDWPCGVVCRHR